MWQRFLAWILGSACVLGLLVLAVRQPASHPAEPAPPPIEASAKLPAVDYTRDILPILSSKCFACHGPDAGARKAGIRLDLRDAAVKPARSGSIPINPGQAAESEVIQRIFTAEESERMPPIKGGKPLTEAEKNLVKRWIDEGAPYAPHWAFVKPHRPAVPEVQDRAWVKNEIDAFILHRLEQEGLRPAPPADRVTLIRRLSLDLRGLPPSLAEVDEFCADTSADAYAKLVERMLASPHYGEKMAQVWLDLARFGDTSGYHFDSTRQMWLWREWVIDAFNKNMPFDQFTVEQLAGDLLPNAGVAQKVASGFNRNSRFNEEGGVDPEEYVIRYTTDRVNTLGQVWLGMTLGCVECHSHKYDPISHEEYYQLYAFFTGIAEPMKSGNHGEPLLPILKVPAPEQTKALAEQRDLAAKAEKWIARELERVRYQDPLEKEAGKLTADEAEKLWPHSQIAWEFTEAKNAGLPADVQAALKTERSRRSVAQKKTLRDYYLRKINEDTRDIFGPLEEDLDQAAKKIKEIEDAIPHTLVSQEMPTPRPAHVLIRGDFQQKGKKVERGVPAVFPPMPPGQPANRLGLARWLVSADHPLTARVAVNRLWTQMFGEGIVRSLGDFGTQGDHPSHPELLDWLAVEFMSHAPAWDVKALLRTMALSATYQQSSVATPESRRIDPANRLCGRASRHRLSAEEIRDSALAISGLLNNKIGGPSFMPYQPRDFFKGKNEDWLWKTSEGDEQNRRGLYAFWRRNSLHPMFAIFDAPTREECTISRQRSNTPLQALVTLNDPTFVEAARVLAQKILTQGPADLDARLTFAFRCATCRLPDAAELNILRRRYRQQFDEFQRDEEAAARLINVGQSARDATLNVVEHAAWTAIANMILNLDEVFTRE